MVRVGVLGAGFMGGMHAQCYANVPGVEVATIFGRTERRAVPLAEQLGAKATTDMSDILDDDSIDAISVCLPTPQHAEVTLAALERGKHVLCEKPLAMTAEEAQRIVDAAAQSDRVVMVAHVVRFWQEYVALAQIVEEGTLGRPIAGFASRRSPIPAWSDLFFHPELTGGAVIDLQVHDLDVLNWIFGTPRSVIAKGLRSPKTTGWDHNLVTVSFENGAVATAEGSMMMPDSYPFSASLRVLCERGCVEYNFQAGGRSVEMGVAPGTGLTIYPDEGDPQPVEVEQIDPYQAQINYFIDCVRQGTPALRATPEAGLAALRVGLAARASLESGNEVTLDDQ